MSALHGEFYLDDDALIVRIAGELDLSVADHMRTVTKTALNQADGASRLVIDMPQVSFADSSALGALLDMQKTAKDRALPMVLHGVGPRLERVLEISGLAPVFDSTPN